MTLKDTLVSERYLVNDGSFVLDATIIGIPTKEEVINHIGDCPDDMIARWVMENGDNERLMCLRKLFYFETSDNTLEVMSLYG
ncbi:MAG: hypothetical protein LC122_13710 [Chitinophagales bacterium]|nr:hypothetical protein [Chitinophagales bacterium]